MDIYDVVTKLVGKINPVGESNEDDRRFENLNTLTDLIDKLLSDIEYVARQNNEPEYSVSRAGKFASKFLDQIEEGGWS